MQDFLISFFAIYKDFAFVTWIGTLLLNLGASPSTKLAFDLTVLGDSTIFFRFFDTCYLFESLMEIIQMGCKLRAVCSFGCGFNPFRAGSK